MSESNNVKFVEADGKWLWKRYDADGSVIFRSPLFDTERQAREDYEINGGNSQASAPEQTAPANTEAETTTAPENQDQGSENSAAGTEDETAGTATGEQTQPSEDNSAGSATL